MVPLKITVLRDVTQSAPVDTYQCSHHTSEDGILVNATKILHYSHEAPHYVSCVLTFHCLLFSPNIFSSTPFSKYPSSVSGEHKFFQKPGSHLKTLDARRVT